MRILILGSGGREHALAWRLARETHELHACPGNPGIGTVATLHAGVPTDGAQMVALATEIGAELVVIGPEAPLVAGVADVLRDAGFAVFGPSAAAARMEGSKTYAKQFFARHGIPTAPFVVVAQEAEAPAALEHLGLPVVVKADGLAAGKGVVICETEAAALAAVHDMLTMRRFGTAGAQVVIEKKIIGREVSVLAITDGKNWVTLPTAEDHKTIFDHDQGPNTGGMGTVSPSWISDEIATRIEAEILAPTVAGLRADGIDYRGVLYAGVMVDESGAPWLLEYNCRFGDPETQVIMARIRGGLGATLRGAADGDVPPATLLWSDETAVCVILAAPGYPEAAQLGGQITGLPLEPSVLPPATPSGRAMTAPLAQGEAAVFHAGTVMQDGALRVAGGRVLGVTAVANSLGEARAAAYDVVDEITFAGKQFRSDIGLRPPARIGARPD